MKRNISSTNQKNNNPCDENSEEPCDTCTEYHINDLNDIQCYAICKGKNRQCNRTTTNQRGYCTYHFNIQVDWFGVNFMELPHDVRMELLDTVRASDVTKQFMNYMFRKAPARTSNNTFHWYVKTMHNKTIDSIRKDLDVSSRTSMANYLHLSSTCDFILSSLSSSSTIMNMGALLRSAIQGNHVDSVRLLLKEPDVDPNEYLESSRNVDVLDVLFMDHRTTQLSKDHALLFFCEAGHDNIVKMLLDKNQGDPTWTSGDSWRNTLMLSSWNGHTNIVKMLLEDGRVDPRYENSYSIKFSCLRGRAEIVRMLLDDGRSDLAHTIDFACSNYSHNHIAIVEMLLADGRPTPSDRTLLQTCERGYTDTFRLLLADGRADPAVDNNVLIRSAYKLGHTDTFRLLLADGRADPAVDNNILIRSACKLGHTDMVGLLLEDGRADPTVDNNYPIGAACSKGHVDIVRLLLNDGRADPSDNDSYSMNIACHESHNEIVKMLLHDGRANPVARLHYCYRMSIAKQNTELKSLLHTDPRFTRTIVKRKPQNKKRENRLR